MSEDTIMQGASIMILGVVVVLEAIRNEVSVSTGLGVSVCDMFYIVSSDASAAGRQSQGSRGRGGGGGAHALFSSKKR